MQDDPLLIDKIVDVTVVHGLLGFVGIWVYRKDLFERLHQLVLDNPALYLNEKRADAVLKRLAAEVIIKGEWAGGERQAFQRVYVSADGATRLRALLEAARQRYESGMSS
jgi:hypothetical protein